MCEDAHHAAYGVVKAGELNLAWTIWGLRARHRKPGEGRSLRRVH
jgi:hypothetical protein